MKGKKKKEKLSHLGAFGWRHDEFCAPGYIEKGPRRLFNKLEPLKMKRIFMPGQAAAVTAQRIDQRYTVRRHTHTHRSRSASQRIYTASLILVNLIRILFCISFLLFFLYILYIYQSSSSFLFYISIQGANYSRFLHSFFHPATPFRLYYAVELYHV